jgi:hypothetical protein
LECKYFPLSKTGISLVGICLLGGVFLLGMATTDSLTIVYGRSIIDKYSWGIVGGYISLACIFLIFAGVAILDINNLLLAKSIKIKIGITKLEESPKDEGSSGFYYYVYNENYIKYEICHKLFQLLKEKDIIEAEVKQMKILKIHYMNRTT